MGLGMRLITTIGDTDDMEITKTDYNKVIRYLSDSTKMYRLSDKPRHQDRARQIRNLVVKLRNKNKIE